MRGVRWRAVVPLVVQAAVGFAQDVSPDNTLDNAPIGFLRGDLLAWTGSARTGEVTFRNSDSRVYRCAFDGKTYFERSNQRISVAALQPADRVEILADHRDGTGLCYARTIQLRSDTRFLGDGQSLDRNTLGINTRVFVRAGKNLDDEIEAYQVIWGSILQP